MKKYLLFVVFDTPDGPFCISREVEISLDKPTIDDKLVDYICCEAKLSRQYIHELSLIEGSIVCFRTGKEIR